MPVFVLHGKKNDVLDCSKYTLALILNKESISSVELKGSV